ncbi:MAG: phage tail protein [Chitinophagaceae bacterium]|nr:phage tail protein [Chitinophagaceae bacterium]
MSNQNALLPVYHFQVQWGGAKVGFTEVTGLDIHFEPISYRQGADPEPVTRWIPGLTKYSPITLKRGVMKGDNDFFNWMNSRQGSAIERRDITIQLLNEQHQPVVSWKVKNAFPVSYMGPELYAHGNEIAIETLVLAHEGLEVENA